MKLDHTPNALVIVGGWNKHIFTQDWVRRYLFPNEQDEFKIELLVSRGLNARFIFPRILSKEVNIFLQEDRLNFSVAENKNQNYDRIQELATQLADYLPHTPVTAYGISFLFTEEIINEDLVALISLKDLEDIQHIKDTITGEQYARHLKLNGRTLNFTISLEKEKVAFDFNFHFEIRDLVEFKAGMSETSILELKQEAVQFMNEIYNLELEGETE